MQANLILSAVLILSLAACSSGSSDGTKPTDTKTAVVAPVVVAPESIPDSIDESVPTGKSASPQALQQIALIFKNAQVIRSFDLMAGHADTAGHEFQRLQSRDGVADLQKALQSKCAVSKPAQKEQPDLAEPKAGDVNQSSSSGTLDGSACPIAAKSEQSMTQTILKMDKSSDGSSRVSSFSALATLEFDIDVLDAGLAQKSKVQSAVLKMKVGVLSTATPDLSATYQKESGSLTVKDNGYELSMATSAESLDKTNYKDMRIYHTRSTLTLQIAGETVVVTTIHKKDQDQDRVQYFINGDEKTQDEIDAIFSNSIILEQ